MIEFCDKASVKIPRGDKGSIDKVIAQMNEIDKKLTSHCHTKKADF